MKKLKVVVIGLGPRGMTYTGNMDKEKFEVVAVADPIEYRREIFKERYNISEENCFVTWEDLLAKPKMADIAIISTSDQMHYEPAMKAIEMGYNLLLEKPIAPTYQECINIAKFAKEKGVKILVCHVLRYTKFFKKIKQFIDEGALGTVLSIHHCENVGNLHHAHSYTRGNWGNTAKSSPMLLAKSCHDIDIIQWLVNSKCKYVNSFGSLSYFKSENAPDGSPEYCYQGCPYSDTCYYDATKIYCQESKDWYKIGVLTMDNPTQEDYENVLKNTQYGKCVYKCDNDVVDHQVVNMEFENGAVASFNMSSFNEGGRYIRVMGTEGEIYGDMDKNTIDYYSFKTRTHEIINPNDQKLTGSITDGHGGGDKGIVEDLYEYMVGEADESSLSEIKISTQNHLIVFAAEEARLEKTVVDMNDFEKKAGMI